jgi:tetratricopeptide (TPR) repeat protein
MFGMGNEPMTWPAATIILLAVTATQTSTARYPNETDSAQVKALCNSPSFDESHRLGEEFLRGGKAGVALAYLAKAHQMCPSNYAVGRDLAIAYGKTGLLQKARAVAEEMLRDHDVAELHSLLGELYTQSGDPRSAAEQYQAAAKIDPSEDNIFDLGSSLLKFEGDSAIRIFRFGVGKYPNSEKLHLGLGSALYGQGLMDEAVAEAYKASELNPEDPEPMEVLGEMAHIPTAMSGEILEKLSALHALYPRNAHLTYYYAMAISGRWSDEPAGDVTRVVDLLKTATELDPKFADAHFQLGEFYQERDRPAEALHSYQEAAKLEPMQESYHYRLALAYKKCGYLDEFRREMQIYQKLHAKQK